MRRARAARFSSTADATAARLLDQGRHRPAARRRQRRHGQARGSTRRSPSRSSRCWHHCRIVKGASSARSSSSTCRSCRSRSARRRPCGNAGRLMKEAGAEAVKLEGGLPFCRVVQRLTDSGIPVMGHLGLTPQSIHRFGTYRVRGEEPEEADRILEDAVALEEAGAFAIVLEKIPTSLGRRITERLTIPTIGIGAGPACDGQILVTHDMLGLFTRFHPRFVRRYANLAEEMVRAFKDYAEDVREGRFPTERESY
ncbi:MAG: 3-methyl-2-oxobutanoate hydroxymethyltransferase [Planctomycetota bacterium]